MPSQSRFSGRRVPLPGSERHAFNPEDNPRLPFATPDEVQTAVTPEGHHITVSVIVRRKAPLDLAALASGTHPHLTHEELEQKHGPDPASLELVKAFAEENGLSAEEVGHTRTVHVTGSAQQLEKAFDIKLLEQKTNAGTLRVRQGTICVPEELVDHIEAVLGLDNRPQAKPHSRHATPHANGTSYSPVQVAQLYNFPNNLKAAGQTIAIIELGGGFRPADIQAYFTGLGIPVPNVTAVSVDKGKNKPGNPSGADGEVMLDIEVAAAVAQGANIVVYFAPNTDQGFVDAIVAAVHDSQHNPSVISISWGGPESSWTPQAMNVMDQACQSAAAVGITVTVASGDNGSTDGVTDGQNHVDFPASSPHVLACGGTKLTGSNGKIQSEVVWNEQAANEGATGGGVSTYFAKPAWQNNANVPAPTGATGGRGVPDVSGDADPATGYVIRVDGQTSVIGGTSAVAPLWAGLIAAANAQNKSRAGFLNPTLYNNGSKSAFHDITQGDNGAFKAGPGWDACTGLGSPIGTAVAQLFAKTVKEEPVPA